MMKHYILNANHEVVLATSTDEWMRFFESQDRIVAQESVNGHLISTVFLSLDHNFLGPEGSEPVLFETMIFPEERGGKVKWFEQYCRRTTSWDKAVQQHAVAVAFIRASWKLWAMWQLKRIMWLFTMEKVDGKEKTC